MKAFFSGCRCGSSDARLPLWEQRWGCILEAAPLALAGFFTYNGMPLEKFLWAVFKSQVLRARPRVFRAKNYWYIFFCEKGRLEKPAALFKYKRKEGKKKDETEMETV